MKEIKDYLKIILLLNNSFKIYISMLKYFQEIGSIFMYKEIYRTLVEETNKGNFLNYNSLKPLYNIFVRKYRLYGFAKGFSVGNINDETFGYYSHEDNTIRINSDHIINYFEGYPLFIINLKILKTFFHELFHGVQRKQIDTSVFSKINSPLQRLEYFLNSLAFYYISLYGYEVNELNIEDINYILGLGIELNRDFDNKLYDYYQENHDTVLQERFSDIDSLRLLKQTLSIYGNNKEKEEKLLFINNDLSRVYLNGYDYDEEEKKYITPLENYIEIFGFYNYGYALDSLIEDVYNNYKLSNSAKFRYGFNISNETYDKTYDFYDSLENKIKEKYKK